MGCWNGTCMISNLPIISGEKVKLIFLKKGNEKHLGNSAVCYSIELLSPINMAISAEYNDYGSVENIEEDWNHNIILKYFKEYFKNEIRCDGEEKKEFDLSDIIDAIERGSLESHVKTGILSDYEHVYRLDKMKKDNEKNASLIAYVDNELKNLRKETKNWIDVEMSFIMIRQDVWDSVVKNMSLLKEYFYGRDIPNYPTKITYLQYFDLRWENYIKKFKESVSDNEKFRLALDFENNLFGGNSESSPRYLFSIEYSKYLHDNINNLEVVSTIKKLWIESKMIEHYVSLTRKTWMIQSGAGSQNADYDLMLLHGQMIVDIANKKLNENDDYEEEDEESEEEIA